MILFAIGYHVDLHLAAQLTVAATSQTCITEKMNRLERDEKKRNTRNEQNNGNEENEEENKVKGCF